MIRSRSAARRLAGALRGLASGKKKPDFYKPSASSSDAAKNGAPNSVAAGVPSSGGAQGVPAAATTPAGAPAASAPAAAPASSAATAAPPAASSPSAAAATKPAAPATTPALGAHAAPKPAEPAAAAAKPAPPPPPAAAAAAAPQLAPTPAAPLKPPTVAAPPAAGGSGGGGSGTANGWLLHPAVPIDVRLLGAGLLGAGALAYTLSGGGKPAAPKQPGVAQEAGFSMQTDDGAPAPPPDEPPLQPPAVGEPPAASDSAQPEGGAADAAVQPAAEQQQQEAEGKEEAKAEDEGGKEEAVTYVDGSQVLGLIDDVFKKEAQEQLAQLERQAAEEIAAAAAGSSAKIAEAGGPAAAAAPALGTLPAKPGGGSSAAKGAAAARQRDEERVAAVQSALADQVGEAVARDFVKGSRPDAPSLTGLLQAGKHKAAAAGPAEQAPAVPPTSAAAPLPTQPGAAEVAAALERAQRVLGLQVDVSAAGLISEALSHGMGPAADWSDYPQRHRQAEADAVVLSELLQAAAASVERQLAAARAEAEAGRAEAAAARRRLAEEADSFKKVLSEALVRAEEQQRQQLRRQAEQLATAHAEMTVRERVERAARLDGVREQLNALQRAFHRRSNEQRTSHEAHQLSVAAFGLRAALGAGTPLREPLALLACLAPGDPVVAAALAGVPPEAAAAGLPTRAQLADRFWDVQRLSRALAMVPEGQGGMLSVAVAKLAASLKIEERGPLAASLPGGGVDHRLAAARQRLTDGQLLAAAAELEATAAGTAASGVVAGWARAVRARVAAEQSAALLEAHAAAETASLA